MYWAKLSIPGKQDTELSYIFADDISEQENSSVLLFGVFDVKSTGELYHTIIKETVKHYLDFYHTASPFDSVSSEEMPDSTEFIFENSIQYTYEKVSDSLRDLQETSSHRQAVDIRKVNCMLGAIIDETLYLSMTGSSIQPLLIYPVSHKNGPTQYMLMNIAEGQGNDHSGDPHARLFSNLVSGSLSIPSCTLMICNQTFLDYISPQQIKQTISNSKIHTIIPYFEHLLTRVHARSDFSALLITRDPSSSEHRGQRPSAAPATSRSMAGLNGTAESTTSILTPRMRPMLSKGFRGIGASFMGVITHGWSLIKRVYGFMTAPEQLAVYRKALSAITHHTRRIATSLPHTARTVLRRLQNSRSRFSDGRALFTNGALKKWFLRNWRSVRSVVMRLTASLKRWLESLSTLSRSLLVLSIIFIILFFVSLISLQVKNSYNRSEARLKEIFTAIDQKQSAADASLIYDDRTRAQELLLESKVLFGMIEEEFTNREDYKKVRDALIAFEQKIYNITAIDNPAELAALPLLPDGSPPDAQLIAKKSTIVLATKDTLYEYDRTKKILSELPVHEKIPGISCGSALSEKEVIFCSSQGDRLYALSFPGHTVRAFSLVRSADEKPDMIRFFNNRLYTLSRESGLLIRHERRGDTYATGVSWLKESSAPLIGARDFLVDGLIYVLTAQGSLAVYRSGTQAPSPSVPNDTASFIASAQKIVTDEGSENLYALDPVNKKIIIISKSSLGMVEQIASSAFQIPSDIAVSKAKKTILVLDKGRLLSLPYDVR